MAAQALRDTESVCRDVEVWDGERLSSLLAEVGENGVRDILRLFQADLAFLQDALGAAVAAGNEAAARKALRSIADAAAGLGLAALAGLAKSLAANPLEGDAPQRVAREAARVRVLPAHRQTH